MFWQIDESQSEVTFTLHHRMMFPTKGHFNGITGQLSFGEGLSGMTMLLEIDPLKITTGNMLLDRYLHDQMLCADEYPVILFRSDTIQLTSPFSADIQGEVSLCGRQHAIKFQATLEDFSPEANQPVFLNATGKFDRHALGLSTSALAERLGGFFVGAKISIVAKLSLVRAEESSLVPTGL